VSTERGSATVEFTWLTLLLLVPLVYVVIAVFETQRTAYAVAAASEAAARAFIQADDPARAESRARVAARLVLADHDVSSAAVSTRCRPACFVPGSTVVVDVRSSQRLPLAPDVFGDPVAAFEVSSTHTEPFGRYRAAP
jgi:Flp pilus assembly protein TadG